jgi:hypothetical protein
MYIKSYSMAANRNSEVMADTATLVEMRRPIQTHVYVRFEISTVGTAKIAFFWACNTVYCGTYVPGKIFCLHLSSMEQDSPPKRR